MAVPTEGERVLHAQGRVHHQADGKDPANAAGKIQNKTRWSIWLWLSYSFVSFLSFSLFFLYSAMLQDKYRTNSDPSGFGFPIPLFHFCLIKKFIFCHAAGQIVIQNKTRWPVFLSHPFVSVLSFLFCPLTDFSTSLFLSLIFLTCSSTFLPLICLRLCHSLYLSFLFFNFFSHLTSVGVAWVVLT